MKKDLKITPVERITEVGIQQEYREKLLPAYVISYANEKH
jgi:hypothetical protein